MRRSLTWVGSGLALAMMASLGIFFASDTATAKPKPPPCDCPDVPGSDENVKAISLDFPEEGTILFERRQ